MRYLFGDSTEFPLQRNFLELLNSFVDISVESIINENEILLFKEDIDHICKIKDTVQDNMDLFSSTVDNMISDIVSNNGNRDHIVKFAGKSKDFLKMTADIYKENFSQEVLQETSQLEKMIYDIREKNRKMLERFFYIDPIYAINKECSLKTTKEGYSIKIKVEYEGDISCIFDIPPSELFFWGEYIKTSEFVKGIEIPIGMKKVLFRKELKPEYINVDDYIFSDIIFSKSGQIIEIVLNERLGESSQRFRLKIDLTGESSSNVYYIEKDSIERHINEEFKNELDMQKLHKLGKKIVEQIDDLSSKKPRLENICLNSTNIIENDNVFEFVLDISKIYAPIIAEINKHSPLKEELSLKIEEDINQRKEIYLKKSQIKDRLNIIKDKGDKLFECLGLNK